MSTWICAGAAIGAFILTWLSGYWLIPLLHKLKYGQTILDIGPKWHKAKKEGTATMGGIGFIIAVTICFTAGMILLANNGEKFLGENKPEFLRSVSGMIMALLLGLMGFLDDFIKVKKKHNEGLSWIQKVIFQVMIIAAYFATMYINGLSRTVITFPGGVQWDLGWLYYPLVGLLILYMVNAVNLTDGIDGLCSSVTTVYTVIFTVITAILGMSGQRLLAFCAAGGCIGFLTWNAPPAKVFMGDTGSMFLGGIVCALGLGCGAEFLMVIAGIVYVLEALSVVIQSTVFKITKKMYHTTEGKRLFKMTPIHHHFELSNWSELKIDIVFSIVGLLFGALSIVFAFNMFGK
ncbi:MAG: phospho-N-acetylmuramoyl-pentapeptide-transferase [Oscillospiraceae bacterium]|nr:phospho-N-acetylmuramoyl-pentapeptide-transferase [Oscillospiraceae bacterium]